MVYKDGHRNPWQVALLAEGVDRNAVLGLVGLVGATSPSSRRAWIEMYCNLVFCIRCLVALLAEGVDRNPVVCRLVRFLAGRPPRGGRG